MQACDRVAERHDGIGAAGVGPRVAACAGERDLKAAAAERGRNGHSLPGAVKHQVRRDARTPRRVSVDVPGAAQVALPFFAHIAHKDDAAGRLNGRVTQRGRDGQQSGQAGSVVACAGRLEPRTGEQRRKRRVAREHSIEMGGQQDHRRRGLRARSLDQSVQIAVVPAGHSSERAEHIAGFVDVRVCQAQLGKALHEPRSTQRFSKRRRGDGDALGLPAHNLLLVEMQPAQSRVYGALRGNLPDLRKG